MNNINPNNIKELERALIRQRRSVRNLYILATVMLANTAICAKTDNPEWMVISGITGFIDCYLADRYRKGVTRMRQMLDEYNKKLR